METLVLSDADQNAGDKYTLSCDTNYTVMRIDVSMTGTVTDNTLSVTVDDYLVDTGERGEFTEAGKKMLIDGNIIALAEEDVVLTAAEVTDDTDEMTDVRISLLTSNDAVCTLE